MRKQQFPLLLLPLLLLAACKPKREDLIARDWQEVSMSNQQMDEVMRSQQAFIDTVGAHTDAADNLEQYGVTDIDSFRRVLQENMTNYKAAEQRSIAATRFDFRKDGILYIHTEDGLDSAAWSFEEDGNLLLDEQKLKGVGQQLHVEVLALADTVMRLKFTQNASVSTTLFRPVKK